MNDDSVIRELLLAGVPTTGKTSYLAVLYTAIIQSRTPHLLLGSFQDDREYLNRIANRLLECSEAVHTEVEEQGELRLSLLVGLDRTPGLLRIPDLSGETWEHALYERTWSGSLDARVRSAAGILLFLHVTKFDAGASIVSAQLAASALGEDIETRENGINGDAERDDGGTSAPPPTQVQVVDLLQLLCEERAKRPTRVSIVLSAWDLTDQSLTPSQWIATNAPLVGQYLRVNRAWLQTAIWGVSAQGGSFRDSTRRNELLTQDAVERAKIVDGIGEIRQVEDPVVWALRAET